MDSVTQIALGAAIGEQVLGKKLGGRAALAGAICGTLPDLDSFIPYADAVASVTYHRSFSHSLIVLTLVSPLIAWGLKRGFRLAETPFRAWWWLCFLALITHPMLDFFTVYGTQLFWPVYDYPWSGSTVFIIDPAYTLPLAIGVIIALTRARDSRARHYSNMVGLGLSCLYLAWSVVAKFHIEGRVKDALAGQGIVWTSLLSTPAPFNTALWRLVVMAEGGYYEAFYHVLDAPHQVRFDFYPDQKNLLDSLTEHWPVPRLQWFTHGIYAVRRMGEDVVMTDLRMGLEPGYTFNFRVARVEDEQIRPVTSSMLSIPLPLDQLGSLWARILAPVPRVP